MAANVSAPIIPMDVPAGLAVAGEPRSTPDLLDEIQLSGVLAREIFVLPRTATRPVIRALLTAALLSCGLLVVVPTLAASPVAAIPAGKGAPAPAAAVAGATVTVGRPGTGPLPIAPAPAAPAPAAAVTARPGAQPTAAPKAHSAARSASPTTAVPAPPATPVCVPENFRLTVELGQPVAAGSVTVDARLTNISGHACISYGDDWRVDFTDTATPPRGLSGEGGGAATSAGTTMSAGGAESETWSWNGQTCGTTPCGQAGPGSYRASIVWDGVSAVVAFTLT